MQNEPINCPFCGGKAIAYYIEPHIHEFAYMPDYKGGGFVECSECTAIISAETKENAIEAWNRRVNDERL